MLFSGPVNQTCLPSIIEQNSDSPKGLGFVIWQVENQKLGV